jgi:hypothetical protein
VPTFVSSSHSHLKFLKLLKFLKVLKNTICFGQYGHPQVLKLLVGGNCCYCMCPFDAHVCCAWCVAPRCFQLSILFLNAFKKFKCECENLTSVCTQDGELIVIEFKILVFLSQVIRAGAV